MPPLSEYRLGPVGNLIRLPLPQRGIDATPDKVSNAHELLSGARTFDVAGVRRNYKLGFAFIDRDELATLEALFMGVYGPGPFVLIDPARINLLTAQQSSATSVLADTTGFATIAASTAASSLLLPRTGLRSVLWDTTDGTTSGNGGIAATYGTYGATGSATGDVPVIPSTSYTGSVYAQIAGGGASLSCIARVQWYTSAGTFISNSDSSPATITNAGQTRLTVSATSPSTAALARLSVLNNATIPAAHTGVHLTDWQLEQAAAVTAWVPGSGVPRVHVAGLTDVTPLKGWHNAELTLLQAGAA